ncbi:MAG: hypothetical protein IPJ42_16030 [Betaproteobacteria bacterium]|jgi:hypothetical protein|nr:hypothetical protein [Betaproteobacteria bacterium]
MTKRLLDYDPITGVSCYYEHTAENVVLTHEQDASLVQSILDANKQDAADQDKTKRGIKQDWWKYASVPTIVEVEWLQKYGVSLDNPAHKKKIFQLLNHPDYRYLKTTDKIHTINAE